MKGRVLIVAGSDSGGGAGIQADIKTVTALKGYAATAITALTVQDTLSVYGVSEVAPSFVAAQINAVLDDIGADCLKTGMLHNAGIVDAVADAFEAKGDGIPLVLDPVMAAKNGDPLLDTEARQALKRRLLIHATILTPNLPEAELLTGMTVASRRDMSLAAQRDPRFNNAAYRRGIAQGSAGDHSGAVAAFKQAREDAVLRGRAP